MRKYKLEKRKIQKVGRSTLSVSLPKAWIHLKGVKPGDNVYIEPMKDGSLKILNESSMIETEKQAKVYTINCDRVSEPNLLERLIVGSYMQGINAIKIFSSTRINGKQIEEIRNITRRLIGLSIIDMSGGEITLRCFVDPFQFNINSLVQNLSIVTSTMLSEAFDALFELDAEIANDVIERENEANNIFWLIKRLVTISLKSSQIAEKIGFDDPFNTTDISLVSKNLETISDCSVNIAKIALDFHRITHTRMIREDINESDLGEIPNMIQLVKEVFSKTKESLFSRNLMAANDAINLRKKLNERIETIMRTTTAPYLRVITITIAIIAENCASIASLALDLELRRSNFFPSV